MQKPPAVDKAEEYWNDLVQSFDVDFKSQSQWDSMKTSDFARYDAVIVVDTRDTCKFDNLTSYYPYSNAEQWGPAIKDGNIMIVGANELLSPRRAEQIDPKGKMKKFVQAATNFTVDTRDKVKATGAYISIGLVYLMPEGSCVNRDTKWLDTAFGANSTEDLFRIVSHQNNRRKHNIIVGEWNNTALENISDAVFWSKKADISLALFEKYPHNFKPFAQVQNGIDKKNQSESGKKKVPFVLVKHGKDKCSDNGDFRFKEDPIKSCEWISNLKDDNEFKFAHLCTENNKVQKNCPQTCGLCPKQSSKSSWKGTKSSKSSKWKSLKSTGSDSI